MDAKKTPTQRASLGRIVLVRVSPASNNGSDVASAVITRVWGESAVPDWGPASATAELVNVHILLDNSTTDWRKSVALFDTEDQARAVPSRVVAWWPPRT